MKKERRWQLANVAKGFCSKCGKRRLVNNTVCFLCREKVRRSGITWYYKNRDRVLSQKKKKREEAKAAIEGVKS